MRKRRLKNTIFLLLALLLCGAGGLAAAALLPSGQQALGTAVFAGTFLTSPRTCLLYTSIPSGFFHYNMGGALLQGL